MSFTLNGYRLDCPDGASVSYETLADAALGSGWRSRVASISWTRDVDPCRRRRPKTTDGVLTEGEELVVDSRTYVCVTRLKRPRRPDGRTL